MEVLKLETQQRIAFLGAGSMAEAMIAGIVGKEKLLHSQIIVTNRNNQRRLRGLEIKYGVKAIKREQLNFENLDILIIATKPKDIEDVLDFLKTKLKPHVLILSVVAGITTSYLEENMPIGQQVIRIMPNTSCLISESATAMSPGKNTGEQAILKGKELLKKMGSVYLIEEDKMDIFTGIAGSGPAYFYYLMEQIEREGKEGGLDIQKVREIGAQTLLGAAKMVLQQIESPAKLRERVTSPNGTTAAGLAALEKYGGGIAISQAIRRAASRSKEISTEMQKNNLKR
jgi:pyrroline-5-carboxylate reductase